MEALLLAVVTASNILCFVIGARVGQKVAKGEEVTLPKVDPMEAIRQREARLEAQKVKNEVDTILRNIDRYDGTGSGQEEVPR